MANNIETAWIEEYKNAVYMNVQVTGSKFLGKTREESIGAEAKNYETLDPIFAAVAGARFSDTAIADVNHGRRKVYPVDYEVANLIDAWDDVKMLVDFRSPYVIQQSYGLNRKRDIEVFKAALGTAQTETSGVPGTTDFDFANSVDMTLGGAGLTIEKLASARTKLKKAGYDLTDPNNMPYFVASPEQMENLLATQEVGSIDYNSIKALVQGEVNSFYGFTFIESNQVPYIDAKASDLPTSVDLTWTGADLPTASSSDRACFAFVKKALLLATNPELDSSIDKRADKRNAWQAYSRLGVGGVRMEENGVVLVGCTEA